MKTNSIFIDYRNKEQVKWWNEVASKLVRVCHYTEIVETATNKPVGILLRIGGLFQRKVMKDNLRFIDNPKKMIVKAIIKD